jgi:Tol biopolymer transport system component
VLAEVSGQEAFRGAPAWSPDGKRIAGIAAKPAPDLSSTIVLFDAATGQRQDLATLPRTLLNSLAWLRDGAGIVSTGTDLNNSIMSQVLLHAYPGGRSLRITNDFNQYVGVSAARSEDTIAALRNIRVSNFWLADAAGAPARRLTSITTSENSPGGPVVANADTIVYQAPEDRTLQIWSIDVAKAEPRRLTSGDALSINPRTAKGVVVFDRMDATGMHVWRMGTDGSAARVLTSGAGEQAFDFSSDGRYVLHMRFDNPRTLYVASADDGRTVFSIPDATGNLGFSQDAKSVAIGKPEKDANGLTIAWQVFPIGGGAPTATLRPPARATSLRLAPDGLALTFLNPADPASNVYRQGPEGQPVAITRFKEGKLTAHRWSPDGRKLALRVQSGDTSNLWVTDADGSHPLKVTQLDSEVFGFDWLPDNRGIVIAAGTSSWDAVLIRGFR